MTLEWSNEKVIAFLEILQTEPCLWDPRLKSYKNRASQNDAWRRIMELLPFKVTIEEIKKKKESLMGYYRTHLNKYKKSLRSGAGKDDVYTTNWFAYELMDSFLREVYESNRTLNTEIQNDYSEAQDRSEGRNDGNENSPLLSSEIEKSSQNIEIGKKTRPRESKSSHDCGRKRQLKDDFPPEIKAAQHQMDEAFAYVKKKKDDEYEIFGQLITNRLEQQSAESPNPSSYQSPPGPSTSLSPHHEINSPSPNPSSY